VHDIDLDLHVLEHLAHVVHTVLGATEHQDALGFLACGAAGLEQRAKELRFLCLGHGAEVLVDRVRGLAHTSDLDGDGVGKKRVDGALDRRRDGRGEEKRLVLGRQGVHYAADARPKSHVEHAVGLIEDKDLHAREAHVVVLHEVEQAPRGGDEEVAAGLELLDLLLELGAAHDDDRALTGLLAHDLDDVVDLRGELAGRGDDERMGAAALLSGDSLKRGQREGCGLARAGLRGGDDVAPLEHVGDGASLDRGRRGEAEGIDPGEDLLV